MPREVIYRIEARAVHSVESHLEVAVVAGGLSSGTNVRNDLAHSYLLTYDTSEDNKQDLLIKTQNFKAIYEKWQTNSIPLITIGSDPLTGDNDNYVLEKKSNIE